jgi:hypothetical protein
MGTIYGEGFVADRMSTPEPVAIRYRDRHGRWRYLNYPFTKGWTFPPNLGTPVPLYEHPPTDGVTEGQHQSFSPSTTDDPGIGHE